MSNTSSTIAIDTIADSMKRYDRSRPGVGAPARIRSPPTKDADV